MDKYTGGYLGLLLGEALSAPHTYVSIKNYTGSLVHKIVKTSRTSKTVYGVIGQIDKTQMSIVLLRHIQIHMGICRDQLVQDYIDNEYFPGIKTVKGYEARCVKDEIYRDQTNGSLIRAYPLIFLSIHCPDVFYTQAIQDTDITNPNPVNRDCTCVYLTCLYHLHIKTPVVDIFTYLYHFAQTEEVKTCILQIIQNKKRLIDRRSKTWVVNTLYYALLCLWTYRSSDFRFSDAIGYVLNMYGDIQANCAVAGSLIGTYLGESKMREDPQFYNNIEILLKADSSKGEIPQRCMADTGYSYIKNDR